MHGHRVRQGEDRGQATSTHVTTTARQIAHSPCKELRPLHKRHFAQHRQQRSCVLTPLLLGYQVTKEIRSHGVDNRLASWARAECGRSQGAGSSKRILIACRLWHLCHLQVRENRIACNQDMKCIMDLSHSHHFPGSIPTPAFYSHHLWSLVRAVRWVSKKTCMYEHIPVKS
jgi:hypothetical protein